jgi:hypothetical protein
MRKTSGKSTSPPDRLRTPRPSRAEEQSQQVVQELYLSVGVALGAWNGVESALADIFATLILFDPLEPDRLVGKRIPRIAFWRARAFLTRLDMVDALMKSGLIPVEARLPEWEKLKVTLKRKNEIRNKIAHGVVREVTIERKGTKRSQIAFQPFADETKDNESPQEQEAAIASGGYPYSSKKMTVGDFDKHILEFNDLAERLKRFELDVVGCSRQRPSPPEALNP